MGEKKDPVPGLLSSMALVDAAIALAKKALLDNPSVAQERDLNRLVLRLEAERAILEADLDAALAESTKVKGPTAAQLEQIERLSNEVESATNSAMAVSARIGIAQKALDLVSSILS